MNNNSFDNCTAQPELKSSFSDNVGDDNGSVTANLLGGVEKRNATNNLAFEADDQFLTEGEEVEIKFTSEDFHVSGFQFTFNTTMGF